MKERLVLSEVHFFIHEMCEVVTILKFVWPYITHSSDAVKISEGSQILKGIFFCPLCDAFMAAVKSRC